MSSPRRVLVVEDDEGIREALVDLLASEGFVVTSAIHGADALDQLGKARELPEVILLDLMMPVMDGWDFRATQRRHPRLASIPVVVLTASRHADAASLSPKAYLQKPIDFEELVRVLRA